MMNNLNTDYSIEELEDGEELEEGEEINNKASIMAGLYSII